MKNLILLLTVCVAVLVVFGDEADDRQNEIKWLQFKVLSINVLNVHSFLEWLEKNLIQNEQGKEYHHSEESERKVRFLKSDNKIQKHNSENHSYKLAHNSLSDKVL